ncbi:XRN 5'-3' exonuclease [Balamuthia mandrillaris]
MHRLKKSLCYWVCSRLQNDRKYHAIKFFVSGPDVAGEGEVKIMENISVRARQDSNFRKVQSHLIVGSDADLILMGLSSSIDNMFILTTDGQSPDFLLFSVHQFSASMQLWFPGSDCNRIKLDFMLLSLFLGNDYLPKLRCCSFESLWQRYKRLKYNPRYKAEYLFNKEDYTLNWSFLLDVFGSYGKHIRPLPKGPSPSSQRIQTNQQRIAPTNGTNTKEKNNDEEEDDEVICFRGFLPGSASVVSDDKSKENIDEEKDEAEMDGEQVEEEEEGENDEDDIQLEGLAYGCDPYEYMQGILWCAKMYIEGRCPDYRWYYHYRYAPTAAEIRQCFLPGHIGITQRSKSNNRRGRGRGGREGQQQQTIAMPDEEEATPVIPARDLHVPSSSEPPLHPYQFCMTVLPLQAKQYVYAPLQQLMNLEESPLAYIYKPDNRSAVVDIDHIKSVVETVPLHSFAEEDKEGLFLGTHLTYARRQSRWKDENKADEFWPKPPISKGIFSLPFPSPPTPKYRPLLAPPSKTLICWRTAHHHAPERVKISSKNHMNNRRQQQQTAAPPSFVPLLFSASSQSVPKKQPQQLQQTATPPSFIPLLSSTSSAQEHQPQQVPKPANPPSFIPLLSSSSPQEQQASPQGYLHSPSNAVTPFYPPFPYYPPHYFYPQSSSFRNGVFYPPPQSDELQQYPLQHQLPPAVFYPPPSSVLPSPFATQTAPAPQQGVSPSSSVDQMAELLRQLQRSSLNSK